MIGKMKVEPIRFQISNFVIDPQKSLTYLGIVLNQKMRYTDHLVKVAAKVEKATTALARLMPNIGGPSYRARRLLASVTTSMLIYEAEV